MSKVVIISSNENGRKKVKTHVSRGQLEFQGENDGEDRISQLPFEVIVLILSLITAREAVCTSVLSRTWRHMWKYIYNLNFDATKILHDMELSPRKCLRIRNVPKYVNLVEHVMRSHKAPFVDLLRLRIDFGVGPIVYRDYVEDWIGFAIEKSVTRLEIDLSSVQNQYWEPYDFHFYKFVALVELRLGSFNISGEMIEYILLNCHLLEHLSVTGSEHLVNLKVIGASLQLKCLEIFLCPLIKMIEISAENLKTLKYCGCSIELMLINTPRLVELYFGGYFCKFFIDNILRFSSHLPRLETLGLELFDYMDTFLEFPHFPFLGNLKQLEVKFSIPDNGSFFSLISLLKSTPLLQKLSLWVSTSSSTDGEYREAENIRHNHLKVVELHGFTGRAIDTEIVTYFVNNSVTLEKIIIDRITNCIHPESAVNFKEDMKKISARKQARLLGMKFPRGVTMVIQ